jgi:hypothetical protein
MPYTKLQDCYSKNIKIPYIFNDPYNPYSYTQTFGLFQNDIKLEDKKPITAEEMRNIIRMEKNKYINS